MKVGPSLPFAAMLALAAPYAHAAPLVANGGFESVSTPNSQIAPGYATLPDWTTPNGPGYLHGLEFVYAPGGASSTGANWTGTSSQGNLQLWGPSFGAQNGFTSTSPAGGNYLAMDADQTVGEGPSYIQQTINGLVPGQPYKIAFRYAASQFRTAGGSDVGPGGLYNGATYSGFHVSLGADSFDTPVLNIPSHGFSGWRSIAVTFTASAASETLQFLAQGGPGGLPPVALLDGISLVQVPEPASAGLLAAGLGMVGAGALRRRRSRKASKV